MHFEKFVFTSLDSPPKGAIVQNIAGNRFVPPSLVPEEAPAAPAAPVFNEGHIREAEQNGYRKGFLEGEKEGRLQAEAAQSQVEGQLVQSIEALAGTLHTMIAEHNALAARAKAEVPSLALAIARKVAGHALDINPLPLLETVAASTVERLLPTPHIVITVAESLAPALEERIASHFAANQDPGEITIQGDASLAPGDCHISWENGNLARDTAALWQEIESVIHDMVVASGQRGIVAPHGAPAQPPLDATAPPPTNNPPQGA